MPLKAQACRNIPLPVSVRTRDTVYLIQLSQVVVHLGKSSLIVLHLAALNDSHEHAEALHIAEAATNAWRDHPLAAYLIFSQWKISIPPSWDRPENRKYAELRAQGIEGMRYMLDHSLVTELFESVYQEIAVIRDSGKSVSEAVYCWVSRVIILYINTNKTICRSSISKYSQLLCDK